MSKRITVDSDSLAARVRERRLQLGLSQEDLASMAGLKQPDVSKIERGLIRQTTAIGRLATALESTTTYLEFGEKAAAIDAALDLLWARDPLVRELVLKVERLTPTDRQELLEEAERRARRAEETVKEYLKRHPKETLKSLTATVVLPDEDSRGALPPAKVTALKPPAPDTGLKKTRAQKDRSRQPTIKRRHP